MIDAIGQEIKVGDLVARGVRHGNSGALTIGVVTAVAGDDLYVNGRKVISERTVVIDASRCDTSKLGRDWLGVAAALRQREITLKNLED